jgi:hypothetical protein
MIRRFRDIDSNIPVIMLSRIDLGNFSFENISTCWCHQPSSTASNSKHNHQHLDVEELKKLMNNVLLIVETIGCSDLSSMGKMANQQEAAENSGQHNQLLVELEQLWANLAPYALRHGESSFR